MTAERRALVKAVAQLGLPSLLLLGIFYAGYRACSALAPDVRSYLRAAARQVNVVSDAVPKMERHLQVIADDLPSFRQRLDVIDAKLDHALAGKRGG